MKNYIFLILCIYCFNTYAQQLKWLPNSNTYYTIKDGNLIIKDPIKNKAKLIIDGKNLMKPGSAEKMDIDDFAVTNDSKKILLFTNTQKVWRQNTKGDYYIFNTTNNLLQQVGKSLPAASLMFAKFSPDGQHVAYVSQGNIYVENIASRKITPLTTEKNSKIINGTFDWAYEEEFSCRDGFRWSPNSKQIAYWQIDARTTMDYVMINNTDSIYPKLVPLEYPVAGQKPSGCKIGVVDITATNTQWMQIPDDNILGTYIPRMEWANNSEEIIIQHLNRKQNESSVMLCNAKTGTSALVFKEKEKAWIDALGLWDDEYGNGGWDWLENGKYFLWASEQDGWRHLYKISRDGTVVTTITTGMYDVMNIHSIDEKTGYIYFDASPDNATQKYLYRTKLDGSGKAERITPPIEVGTSGYNISPNATVALHSFTNHNTPFTQQWVSIPNHQPLNDTNKIKNAIDAASLKPSNVDFIKITTSDNITMDAWMVKPANFDSTKKYPIVFQVYTEPWGQLVKDVYRTGRNNLYNGDMSKDGYIYMAIDNRGTPCPKGRAWRKSVYRKIGQVNIKDQAMAAKEILKLKYVDTSRVAVWGWSGGGSATLNLLFQYPEIYKTGIAIAAVANQLTYDNIYQERYMGLPQENLEDFVNGSPITHAKGLQGNLLYIHGTGDDNVHYNNADMLLNELIKHNKIFQFMAYPNRTHSISEGEGTSKHLANMYTTFLKKHCPPGGVAQ
jgi:dipeptidyl-peptidase 4